MSKLLNDVRNKLRVHHYALKTEKTYVQWIRRFILYHNKAHPRKMGKGGKYRVTVVPEIEYGYSHYSAIAGA